MRTNRNRHRRGLMLVECIVVIAILLVLGVALTPAWRALTTGVPHIARLVDTDNRVSGVVQRLAADLDETLTVAWQDEPNAAAPTTLTLGRADGVVTYTFNADSITRRTGADAATAVRRWDIPHARVHCRPYLLGNGRSAVLVQTEVRQDIDGVYTPRLQKTHLLFAGALAARGDQP